MQPLPIPNAIWEDRSMDFIEGLPKSRGKALAHPFTAAALAQLYFKHVFKLHGLPKTIVSNRDKIFLCKFYQDCLLYTSDAADE